MSPVMLPRLDVLSISNKHQASPGELDMRFSSVREHVDHGSHSVVVPVTQESTARGCTCVSGVLSEDTFLSPRATCKA